MINCLIVDDEELARFLISSYLKTAVGFIEVASLASPIEAIEVLKKKRIDLVFLDIQMPQMSGISLAKVIEKETKVIFTTAYSDFAIDGFELNALDYLLKPITEERFEKALDKAKVHFKLESKAESLSIKSGYDLHKILIDDIIFIQSSSEYVEYQLANKKILSYQSLKSLEETLPQDQFIRVHRSFIVNISYMKSLKAKTLFLENHQIPVSSPYLERVRTVFV